ncbi:histidine kinase N-terminal 7TM domain-containing protein [Haloarcula sp. NS06]|uniref:sensor histidine kinase n=1 Tax=unclassified Haloarcula TaxID=2624677 RepID=UPI0027AF6263|nr:histidine kinase N-terminal 7TM domain-containing protein [Haloarcula sp. H-GB4]MDQ2072270.1 histidine kinase N-terminal 7TM domain-containing protein [Haloarcula sp. H-GB4]
MGLAPGLPTWILLGAFAINLGIAGIAVRRRSVRGAVPLAAIMASVALYSLGNGVLSASTTMSTYRTGLVIKYIGAVGLGPTQFWFGLTYSGRESLLTRRRWALLLAPPVIVFGFVVTAQSHDLIWTLDGFVQGPPLASPERENGPVFWFNLLYQYTLIGTTYVIVGLFGLKRSGRYRTQATLMLLGGIIPMIASVVFIFGSGPMGSADPTAFSFTFTGIVFAIALFRFDLLDLMPVARHTLVEEMSDPVFVVDKDERLVDVNEAGADFLDDEGAAIGRSASEVMPSYDSLPDGDGSADADVVIEADGGPHYFDINRTTLTDQTGSMIGHLLIYRDVTDRRIAEERFQRLIERSSDMVTILDEDGDFTYVSQPVEKILGYEPAELVGENAIEYIHPDDRQGVAEDLAKYVDDHGYSGTYVVRFRDAADNWRFIEAHATNLLHDPFVEGIVLNSRDVTEQLQRKQKLERQNERLDQFASIVAHDLRNPLNVASGRLSLLESDVDADHSASIGTIQEQLERMESIIDDSLTLARSGETVTETDEGDLELIAYDAWQSVETDGATLVVKTTLQLDGDRNRLRTLFENLFRNSVEHNESADLTVKVGSVPDGVGFYVEDTGTGIPSEERDAVFEQGYTTNEEGTGFGLAIVRDIVQAHGWDISVTEGESGGAKFVVECHGSLVVNQPETT